MATARLPRMAIVLTCLVVGYFAANVLALEYLPVKGKLRQLDWHGSWIGIDQPGQQAFFRQIVDVPFEPAHAWIAVASDDQDVFVNGRLVIRNNFVTNLGEAFQSRTMDRGQAVTRYFGYAARAPEIRRSPNRESRTPLYADISRFVRPGRNVIAVSLETAGESPRFSMIGAISGASERLDLASRSTDWTASLLATRINGEDWRVSRARLDGWRPAVEVPVDTAMFGAIDPQIWMVPFANDAVTGRRLGNEVRLKRTIGGMSWRGATEGAWLRVRSSWPYELFLDGRHVGSGGTAQAIEVFDVTSFLHRRKAQLLVRLVNPAIGDDLSTRPSLAVDGFVDGRQLPADTGWETLESPHWTDDGEWGPVARSRPPTDRPLVRLQSVVPANARTALFAALWAGCAAAMLVCWRAMAAVLRAAAGGLVPPGNLAAAVLAIPGAVLVLYVLLRLRYKESDTFLWFLHGDANALAGSVMAAGLFAALVTLTASQMSPPRPGRPVLQWPDSDILARLALVAILGIGLYLRARNLGLEDLQADENVSLDAARGILRTGLPEAVSGILYTRSPLYHYPLAGWIWLFGDTPVSARLFSVAAGVAAIGAVYRLARLFGAGPPLALFIALWMAVDPWHITVSRNIRFYQQMQYFALWSFIFFLQGFVLGRDRRSQYLFFAAAAAAGLSQEVFVIVFPGLCIIGYIYYRPFDIRTDWRIILGAAAVLVVIIVDMMIFQFLCLTPHVGIATSSGSILQLHALNVVAYVSTFFSGTLRSNFLLSVGLIAGFLLSQRSREPALAFGWLLIGITVIVATVLVMQIANRYLYMLAPVLATTTIISVRNIIRHWGDRLFAGPDGGDLRRRWSGFMLALLAVAFAGGSEVWRTLSSYSDRTTLAHETAYRFIERNRHPGDVVVSVSPMSGAIVLGGVDYYLMEAIFFDEVYASPRNGVVDRWAGGSLVTNVDRLNEILVGHDRVWILLNEYEAAKMSAGLLAHIRVVSEPALAFFGGELRLWSRGSGLYAHTPSTGAAAASF